MSYLSDSLIVFVPTFLMILLFMMSFSLIQLRQLYYTQRASSSDRKNSSMSDASQITQEQRELSSTEIILWNTKKKVVTSEHVAEWLELICPEGVDIISAEVTTPQIDNTPSIEISDPILFPDGRTRIPLNLISIKPNEGVRIKLLYKGSPSEEFIVKGLLKTYRPYIAPVRQSQLQVSRSSRIRGYIGAAFFISFVIYLLAHIYMGFNSLVEFGRRERLPYAVVSLLILGAGGLLIYRFRDRINLEKYDFLLTRTPKPPVWFED